MGLETPQYLAEKSQGMVNEGAKGGRGHLKKGDREVQKEEER